MHVLVFISKFKQKRGKHTKEYKWWHQRYTQGAEPMQQKVSRWERHGRYWRWRWWWYWVNVSDTSTIVTRETSGRYKIAGCHMTGYYVPATFHSSQANITLNYFYTINYFLMSQQLCWLDMINFTAVMRASAGSCYSFYRGPVEECELLHAQKVTE